MGGRAKNDERGMEQSNKREGEGGQRRKRERRDRKREKERERKRIELKQTHLCSFSPFFNFITKADQFIGKFLSILCRSYKMDQP